MNARPFPKTYFQYFQYIQNNVLFHLYGFLYVRVAQAYGLFLL